MQREIAEADGRLTIFDSDCGVTASDVFASLHSINCDAIYIDYVGLLEGVDGDDQWKKLSEVVRQAKVYAKATNRAVIIVAQLKDTGELKHAKDMMDHAATSWLFKATPESREHGYLVVEMTKGRNQVLMKFTIGARYEFQQFYDLTPDEEASIGEETLEKATKKQSTSKKPSKEAAEDEKYLPDLTD